MIGSAWDLGGAPGSIRARPGTHSGEDTRAVKAFGQRSPHRDPANRAVLAAGTVRLFDGKAWIDGKPGDFLFVPEGGIHAFWNESGAPTSMLILFAPGATREAYFETLARISEGLTMTGEERAAGHPHTIR